MSAITSQVTSYSIFVTHPHKPNIKWQREINATDYNHILACCQKTRKPVSLLRATVIPIRTHNLADFSKDFFLPTVVTAPSPKGEGF